MKLRSSRITATDLTTAVDVLQVFLPFPTGKKMHPTGIVQGKIPAQGNVGSVITVTEKVVNVKWGILNQPFLS